MCFPTEDYELLNKYYDIWNGVKNSIKEEFDSEPIYNKKFLKTKKGLTAMMLHIFKIKKFLSQALNILVWQ